LLSHARLKSFAELSAGFEFGKDLFGDLLQGFEDADALEGYGFDHWFVLAALRTYP
jgi:hypothetical protein